MGTPEFAVPILEAIHKSDNKILEIYTQPAKKKIEAKKFKIHLYIIALKNLIFLSDVPFHWQIVRN